MTNRSADIGASGVTSIMGGERYRPYPAYKDSGVEWLGEIPAHWEMKRLKYAATLNPTPTEARNRGESLEVSFVPMEAIGEYGGLELTTTKLVGEVYTGYTYFREGDVVVAKITPCFENGKGAVATGLVNEIAFGTTELHVLRVKESIDRQFLFYLSMGDEFRRLGEAEMYGAGGQKRVPDSFIRNLMHPLPSLSEQRAIAAFLDRETAKIDALVAKKERLIELLQEKRIALISDAVTKGLDPDVPLKDSGVEWLGEIPVHWEIMRLKQASRIQGGFAFSTDSFRNEGIPVVRMNNIRRGVLDLDNVVRIPEHQCKDAFALNEGDIIYGLSGSIGATGSLGNYAVVRKGDTPAQLNQRVAQFRPMIDRITEKFLVGSLQTSVFYEQVLSYTTGTAQFNVSTNDIGNVVLALPPIKEQRAIAAFLDSETAPINALMARVREAIDRFKELRTALISAAVTGKIDVREAAT